MEISAIVAMAKNRVIGKDNKLPRHYAEDFQYFKKITMGGVLIMWRKTYESIGKPLPKRRNIVISRSGFLDPNFSNLEVYSSIEEAIENIKITSWKIRVIGGAGIYDYCFEKDLIDKLYLTLIKKDFEWDAFFPEFEKNFLEIQREEGEDLDFIVYKKKNFS